MTKDTENKINITDQNDIAENLDFIINTLTAISDREYQLRVWYRAESPEVDWFEECLLSFDTEMDYFKSLLREGKTSLDPLQVKAIIRTYVMSNHFCKILRSENLPENWSDEQLYIINHPLWKRVQNQAAYTLSLLRDKRNSLRPLRSYGSIETRTATRHPKFDDRFVDKMKIFSSSVAQNEQWKSLDDFWNSIDRYDLLFEKYFNGGGVLTGYLFNPLLAFDEALDKLCKPYEDNGGNLDTILSDPNLKDVEQKAQDFLKMVAGEGLEPPTRGL